MIPESPRSFRRPPAELATVISTFCERRSCGVEDQFRAAESRGIRPVPWGLRIKGPLSTKGTPE